MVATDTFTRNGFATHFGGTDSTIRCNSDNMGSCVGYYQKEEPEDLRQDFFFHDHPRLCVDKATATKVNEKRERNNRWNRLRQ